MYQLNPGQGWIQEFCMCVLGGGRGGGHLKKLQKMTSAPKINDFSHVFKHILKKLENTDMN